MKNARNELNDMATENAVGGVSWQFFGEEPVTSEVETSNPSIFQIFIRTRQTTLFQSETKQNNNQK